MFLKHSLHPHLLTYICYIIAYVILYFIVTNHECIRTLHTVHECDYVAAWYWNIILQEMQNFISNDIYSCLINSPVYRWMHVIGKSKIHVCKYRGGKKWCNSDDGWKTMFQLSKASESNTRHDNRLIWCTKIYILCHVLNWSMRYNWKYHKKQIG